MMDDVHQMSGGAADVVFGRPATANIESPLYYEKLLDTHFDPSMVRVAWITALLREAEADFAHVDELVMDSESFVKFAIAEIADASLFVL